MRREQTRLGFGRKGSGSLLGGIWETSTGSGICIGFGFKRASGGSMRRLLRRSMFEGSCSKLAIANGLEIGVKSLDIVIGVRHGHERDEGCV